MKKFKLITLAIFSAASLYANALSLITSSSLPFMISNSSSLPSSLPSSGVLSVRQSILPSSILSLPFPSNLITASSSASL